MASLFTINLILVYAIGMYEFNVIPNYVYDYCEYADLCNRTATKQPPPGQISCCKSCSCADDCGLKLNCCFDYLDKYKLEENGKITCIEPIDGAVPGGMQKNYYFMVTSCSYFGTSTSSKEDDCHWVGDNATSLLAPVTDLVSNTTFVNEDCARCNNVYNTVKWNYFYSDVSTYMTKISSVLWTMENNFKRQIGNKLFVPQKKVKLSTKECYRHLPQTCHDTSPYYNVCQSLNAHMVDTRTIFKNIGCMLCSYGKGPLECFDRTYSRNVYSGTLTVLIDNSVLESVTSEQNIGVSDKMSHDGTCKSWSVKSPKKNRCLQIYCPESMIRTAKGCQYMFVSWLASAILMRVKLVPNPTTPLPVAAIKSLSKHDLSKINAWMELPCNRLRPFLYDIYYENASLYHVKSMDVHLKKMLNDFVFSPSFFLPQLKKCAELPWRIHLGNSSYELIPELSRYYNYVQDGRTSITWNGINSHLEFVRPKLYDKLTYVSIFPLLTVRGLILDVKKTFFCNQVRVPFDEVEMYVGEIRILSTNKTLGNNEFEVNNASTFGFDGNDSSVSVCLEDYLKSGNNGQKDTDNLIGYTFLLYIFILVVEILKSM